MSDIGQNDCLNQAARGPGEFAARLDREDPDQLRVTLTSANSRKTVTTCLLRAPPDTADCELSAEIVFSLDFPLTSKFAAWRGCRSA